MEQELFDTLHDVTEGRYAQRSAGAERHFDRFRKIRNMLPGGGRLLEIGAWDGTTINYYKERFRGETYGTDISQKVLQRAAPFFDVVKICDLNRKRLPFDDDFFDVVICSEVIEHIYDTDNLLINIRDVLKLGGRLIISTPNLASFFNRVFIVLGLQPLYTEVSCRPNQYGNRFRNGELIPAGHIRNFTFLAFRDIVAGHGFAIVEQKAAATSMNKVIRSLERMVGSFSVRLGSDIILNCQKR